MPRGKLIAVSAPSGSGKTTIVKAVLAAHPEMLFSVSATTRPMRNGEVNGKDYFFLSREEFEHRIKAGELVEWEEIYGDLYGTLKSEVERALATRKAMLFDIDVKGALSIKRRYPSDAVLIFVSPPSLEVLKSRLLNRRTEDEEALKRRLERASMELNAADQFDYRVVNDDLQTAVAEVNKIVTSAVQPALH
jgi:guanylate kinase